MVMKPFNPQVFKTLCEEEGFDAFLSDWLHKELLGRLNLEIVRDPEGYVIDVRLEMDGRRVAALYDTADYKLKERIKYKTE